MTDFVTKSTLAGHVVVEDSRVNELRVYENGDYLDGFLRLRLDSDAARFVLRMLKAFDRLQKGVGADKPVFPCTRHVFSCARGGALAECSDPVHIRGHVCIRCNVTRAEAGV